MSLNKNLVLNIMSAASSPPPAHLLTSALVEINPWLIYNFQGRWLPCYARFFTIMSLPWLGTAVMHLHACAQHAWMWHALALSAVLESAINGSIKMQGTVHNVQIKPTATSSSSCLVLLDAYSQHIHREAWVWNYFGCKRFGRCQQKEVFLVNRFKCGWKEWNEQ